MAVLSTDATQVVSATFCGGQSMLWEVAPHFLEGLGHINAPFFLRKAWQASNINLKPA